jgi:hypothetical protein
MRREMSGIVRNALANISVLFQPKILWHYPFKFLQAGDLDDEGLSRYDWCDGSYEDPENGNQSQEERGEDGNQSEESWDWLSPNREGVSFEGKFAM